MGNNENFKMHQLDASETVVLVDDLGNPTGTCNKLHAHQNGDLHLAFSLMIMRQSESGFEYLLQRRAAQKYHSAGQWSNTCCSHPRPGESLTNAVKRRVREELGIEQELNVIALDSFIYNKELNNGLIEHEYDWIFLSYSSVFDFKVNSNEVSEARWLSEEAIVNELALHPENYTVWFKDVFERIIKHHADLACTDPA